MFRPPASLLALVLFFSPLLHGADEPPTELNFSGEPIGSEYPIARGLEADATDLLGTDKTIELPDAAAATLQQGRLVRAFAEALSIAENTDPVIAARSHARRALILARLGAVNFAAEHANLALPQPAVRGEVRLARAWMLWHVGNFEAADREAALATGAPAWALAEWQAHRAKHAPALAKFQTATEPDDRFSPEFLAYTELAASSRAFALADGLYFSAISNLQMQFNHEANFPPANLQRARRGFRDLVRLILGDVAREPGATRLAAVVLATAREVCTTPAPRADWEIYLNLVADIRAAQPSFDFAHYDLHGDLARAEKDAALDPAWREKFKPLLADPRQRLASRVHQALARLEAHPAAELLAEPLDTAFTAEQRTTLQAGAALLEAEDAVLRRLVQALPAGTAPGPRDAEFVVTAAQLRFRLAVLDHDLPAAREQFLKISQLLDASGVYLPLEAYRAHLRTLETSAFLSAYEKLLRHPPADVPEGLLEAALEAAPTIEEHLAALHGEDYLAKPALPADTIGLVQRLLHLRLLVATSTGRVFSAERALAGLQRWCDPQKHPAFAPLPDLVEAVADLPAQAENFTAAEQQIWNVLKEGKADPAFPARLRALIADEPDRFAPRILLPLAHWRLGEDALAAAAIAETKQVIRQNRATLTALEGLADNNDPVRVVRGLAAALQAAPPAERPAQAAATTQAINGLLNHLAQVFAGGKALEPGALPPDARRAYAYCVAGIVHIRLAEGRLSDALALFASLRSLQVTDALAFAEPAIASHAFVHDLPNPDAIQLWRDLLQADPLDDAGNRAFAARMEPFQRDSVSVRIAAVASGLRRANWTGTRDYLTSLRRDFGPNRALARQLDLLDSCLSDCLALDRPPATPELDQRRRAHANDKARAEEERHQRAIRWDQAPEAFKQNWDLTNDRREWEQLAKEIEFHQQKITAIDAEKAGYAAPNPRAFPARLARCFRELNALVQL